MIAAYIFANLGSDHSGFVETLAKARAEGHERRFPKLITCPNEMVANSLALCRGLTPFTIPFNDSAPEQTIGIALAILVKRGVLQAGNTIVIIGSIVSGKEMIDAVQMRVIGE